MESTARKNRADIRLTPYAFLAVLRFTAGFLAAGFLATGFLAAVFFTGFLATAFFTAGFLAAGLAVDLRATVAFPADDFFPTVFRDVADAVFVVTDFFTVLVFIKRDSKNLP